MSAPQKEPVRRAAPGQLAVALVAAALSAAALSAAALTAQQPAPAGEVAGSGRTRILLDRGAAMLEAEDPVGAWRTFRLVPERGDAGVARRVGLGQAHLMLGNAGFATAYGEAALAAAPGRQDAMSLTVRALIRERRFDEAVQRSGAFVQRTAAPEAELLAARGSALFRVQRTSDAADIYSEVVALDPLHAEANLRLGSGLLGPVEVDVPPALRLAVVAIGVGERERARQLLLGVLADAPAHPIAHRLLGETLFAQRTEAGMAMRDEAFRRLRAAEPVPDVRGLPIARFVPGYESLAPARRRVVDRTAALFRRQLDKLVAVGARHDLLHELERTTDAAARRSLRGRRTFDGRVWDDVRGVGGMQAATGIEALDEAATAGFDTFAHEVAHQVHFFTFSPTQRARIRSLYRRAMADSLCLDYYAASNEAEYFGQGVEAFVSLCKRPGGETTHGHTRFELKRIDPDLHDFIAGIVDLDPLADPGMRARLLPLCVAVALRCGRADDALVAASMMDPGETRRRLEAEAAAGARSLRSH